MSRLNLPYCTWDFSRMDVGAMTRWELTTAEVEGLVALAAGRITGEQLQHRLAERGWPENDAVQLVVMATAERQADYRERGREVSR